MGLEATFVLLAVGAALTAYCLWHQRRPRELGDVSLFPANMLLGIGLLLVILALAHLVSVLTGHPLAGRTGGRLGGP